MKHEFIPHPYNARKCGKVDDRGVVCALPASADIHMPRPVDVAQRSSVRARSVDERIDHLTLTLKPWCDLIDEPLVRKHIKGMCLEVARDQRHACAESVMSVAGDSNNPWMIDKDAAHSAVINAELPK